MENQASALEHVQPAGSSKEVDGRARAAFHRYGKSYFLAAVTVGSCRSTYDFDKSNKEAELTAQDPTRKPEVVTPPSNGMVITDDRGPK